MSLPKDAIGRLAAAIVESAVQSGVGGLVLLNRDDSDLSKRRVVTKSITLTGNNTTVTTQLFQVTGAVLIGKIYGVVTTVLGANHTAAYLRINDATAQANITSSSGATLSAFAAGSIFFKNNLAAGAANTMQNNQVRISEPATRETIFFSPFIINQKVAIDSFIEYLYTTTDAPTSGAIKFYVEYEPLSDNGAVVAV